MVLLFTDGEDNSSWLTEKELVNVARESEAIVHVIGLKSSNERVTSTIEDSGGKKKSLNHSNSLNQAENLLEEITKVTGGRVWYADSSAELEQVFLKVLEEMETRYLLSYQLLGVPSEGWHELEVKLKKQRGETIRARPGYVAITSKP
jgi:Ca-activated chloride channel family protein